MKSFIFPLFAVVLFVLAVVFLGGYGGIYYAVLFTLVCAYLDERNEQTNQPK